MFQNNVVTLHAQSAKVFFLYTPARENEKTKQIETLRYKKI